MAENSVGHMMLQNSYDLSRNLNTCPHQSSMMHFHACSLLYSISFGFFRRLGLTTTKGLSFLGRWGNSMITNHVVHHFCNDIMQDFGSVIQMLVQTCNCRYSNHMNECCENHKDMGKIGHVIKHQKEKDYYEHYCEW